MSRYILGAIVAVLLGAASASAQMPNGGCGAPATPACTVTLSSGSATIGKVDQGAPNAGTTNSWWVQLYNSLVGIKGADGSTISSTSNPVPTEGSAAQGSTTSGQTGILGMMATTTSPPTDTNAQTNAIRGDTHGAQRVVDQDTNGTVSDYTSASIVIQSSQYPQGATAITGNSTGSTGAVVGTLAAAVGKTTFICGFDVSALGGTATVGPITVAGLTGSSMVYQFSSLAAGNTLTHPFNMCVPASATNTAITVTTTADGSATAVDVNAWGYRL